jgi:hypothetical protein
MQMQPAVRQQQYQDGEVYIVRNGQLELIEQDPHDQTSKVRITAEAAGALRRARAEATRHKGFRPDLLVIASAVLEHYAEADQVVQAIDAWYARVAAKRATDTADR